MSDLLGSKLGNRYRLDRIIGKGGNGTIFQAHDEELSRDVAIKLLQTEGDSAERLRKRFKTEALAASRIQHPNIVGIYDVQTASNSPIVYMVMELLVGWDLLNELHHKGPLSPERALKLFVPTLKGLAKCHENGVVHKDLKPSNLFIRQAGKPDESMCLLDFGVARLLEGERITRAGGVAGTPRYLAPEYIRDASVAPTVDVYQMGLIFVEALTGTPCIPRGETEFKIFQRHLQGDLDLPKGFNSGRFASVIQRALCVDAEVRYPNAGAFAESLEAITPEQISVALEGAVMAPASMAPEMTTVITDTGSGQRDTASLEMRQSVQKELPEPKEVTQWFTAIQAEASEVRSSESDYPDPADDPDASLEDLLGEPPSNPNIEVPESDLSLEELLGEPPSNPNIHVPEEVMQIPAAIPSDTPVSTVEDRSLQERMEKVKKDEHPDASAEMGVISEDDLGAFVMGAAAKKNPRIEDPGLDGGFSDVSEVLGLGELRSSGEFEEPPMSMAEAAKRPPTRKTKRRHSSQEVPAAPKPPSSKKEKKKKSKLPILILVLVFLLLTLVALAIYAYWYFYM